MAGAGHVVCMDSESGEVGSNFKPQLGSLGDEICTMAHPLLGCYEYTECNAQPAAQASSILYACGKPKLKFWQDTTAKFPTDPSLVREKESDDEVDEEEQEQLEDQMAAVPKAVLTAREQGVMAQRLATARDHNPFADGPSTESLSKAQQRGSYTTR